MRTFLISVLALASICFAADAIAQQPDAALSAAFKPLRDHISKRNYEEALAYVHTLEKRGEFAQYVPALLCELAFMAKISNNSGVVKKSALEVIEKYPKSPYVRVAWCHLGDAHQSAGDHDKMIEAYEKGMDGFRAEPDKYVSRALESAEEAHISLGNHYLARKEWAKGLACWQNWHPNSFCGTCFDEMEGGRKTNIWLCKLHLGKHSEIARETLQRLRNNSVSPQPGGTYLAYLTYRLYARAGQREELLSAARRAEDSEARYHLMGRFDPLSEREAAVRYAGHAVLFCEKLEQLASQRRYQELIDILGTAARQSYPEAGARSEWPLRAAARLLARQGGDAVPLLVQAIERSNPSNGSVNWLYYSLAKNGSPEAWAALVRLQPIREPRTQAKSPAIEIENGWPAPKKGSLPGEFDLTIEPLEELLKK